MNIDERYIKNLLPKRPEDSHKGTFGHVLNVAGSCFYSGAAYFSSLAPLKVGAGRSTLASVDFVLRAVAALSPDIILLPLETLFNKGLKPPVEIYQAISIGCGLSTDKATIKFFDRFLRAMKTSPIPLVIDADGLNILAFAPLSQLGRGAGSEGVHLPQNSILTPHPVELSRLMGVSVENILENQEFWAQKCSEKYKCVTVLKTHKTLVVDDKGHLYRNNTGNSALAKGGSGDVLTGMITGFLASGSRSEPAPDCDKQFGQGELNDSDTETSSVQAPESICNKLHGSKQGIKPFDACVLAVYLHGKAGELASKDLGEYSPLASDLLNYIHLAIRNLA